MYSITQADWTPIVVYGLNIEHLEENVTFYVAKDNTRHAFQHVLRIICLRLYDDILNTVQ